MLRAEDAGDGAAAGNDAVAFAPPPASAVATIAPSPAPVLSARHIMGFAPHYGWQNAPVRHPTMDLADVDHWNAWFAVTPENWGLLLGSSPFEMPSYVKRQVVEVRRM